jgi:uncharacterized membrane protein
VFTLTIAALFLGEIPSARGALGVGLVVIGAYWLNHSSADWQTPFKSFRLKPGVALVLLAGLLWAITPLFEKMAIHHTTPESPRFVAFAVTTLLVLMLTPIVAARGRHAIGKLQLHRRAWLLAAGIAGGAPLLGYTAFSLGLVGYVTALFRLSAVMTVLWASLFLQERHLAHRLPGSLLMALGAILIVA